jgi:heme/copper-type cytochrome/quinol oxidase subunit 2
MKNIKPFLCVVGTVLLPMFAFAHGEIEDGHVEEVAATNPEQRMIVLAVVVGVVLLMGIFVWYARSKNTPVSSTPEKKDGMPPA